MKLLISTITILLSILFISTPTQAGVLGDLFDDIGKAEVEEGPLVNSYQLEEVLKALGNRRIDENSVPNIHYYSDIKQGSLNGGEGYSAGVATSIRALGLKISYGSSYEIKYYALPSLFYFPDNQKKNLLRFTVRTAKINAEISGKIIADVKESIAYKEVNGEKDWSIVYGQTILENTKTTVKADGKQLVIESLIDISNMDTEDALDYFSSFQNKIGNLHAAILRANKTLNETWREEQDAREEEEREIRRKEEAKMMDKHWEELSKPDLYTLSIFINEAVKSPLSDLGHWEYTHENGAFVEEINYGKYFELLYIINSRDNASKENLTQMYKDFTELTEKNAPKGTASIHVGPSNYNNFTAITLKYTLDSNPTGEDIWDYTKDFSDFVADIHDDAKEIRDKYAQKLKYKEFTTVTKDEFIELINDGLEDLKDKSDNGLGLWRFYDSKSSGGSGRKYVIGNFDDHMLLSFIFEDFADDWSLDVLSEAAEQLADDMDDEDKLGADSIEVVQTGDDPRYYWVKLKIKYKAPGMFSSGGLKGSEIKEKYDIFYKEKVSKLSEQFINIARELL